MFTQSTCLTLTYSVKEKQATFPYGGKTYTTIFILTFQSFSYLYLWAEIVLYFLSVQRQQPRKQLVDSEGHILKC